MWVHADCRFGVDDERTLLPSSEAPLQPQCAARCSSFHVMQPCPLVTPGHPPALPPPASGFSAQFRNVSVKLIHGAVGFSSLRSSVSEIHAWTCVAPSGQGQSIRRPRRPSALRSTRHRAEGPPARACLSPFLSCTQRLTSGPRTILPAASLKIKSHGSRAGSVPLVSSVAGGFALHPQSSAAVTGKPKMSLSHPHTGALRSKRVIPPHVVQALALQLSSFL